MTVSLSAVDFGRLIRAALKGRGITQMALAKKLGCNQSQVSRLCRGKFSSPTDYLEKLCQEIGIAFEKPAPPNEKRIIAEVRKIVREKPKMLPAVERALQLIDAL